LLKEHVLIAVDAIDAAIADDERRFRRLDRRWSHNADDIAASLAGANPNWPEGDLQDLLGQHLKLTKHEMLARFNEEWNDDVDRFDDILTEILTMSDALAAGLAAQFPGGYGREDDPVSGLRTALRKLWTDHVIWTRQYIVAAVAGTPDAEAAAGRLLRNQEDIGDAVVPLYGAEAGEELTRLLKEHILIAVDLVAAATKGDKRAFARPTSGGTPTRTTSRRSWPAPTPTGPRPTCGTSWDSISRSPRERRWPVSKRTGTQTWQRSTTSSPRSSPWRTPSRTASWRSSRSVSAGRPTKTAPTTT